MGKLPDFDTQFSDWYNEVVYKSELADQSPVRGCMVIRPYGCDLWERIKAVLDKKIKDTGHQNAIFPLLIPQSFLEKEAKHVEGFAPELAVVTHAGGKQLEEPYVIRPTSETIIHSMFANWIKSWRDLPMKINQWANVMRWEMRTRPFLRTSEFFWQEGHTAHETREEAEQEVELMLNEYVDLAENYLAIPVFSGLKSEGEKFPGADFTCTIEGIMPDGKALQMGTSHLISQDFARSFNMMFQDRQGQQVYPYLTSWGATTRLIGAMVMMHGDKQGLVMPPRVAPIQVVIIPIFRKDADKNELLKAVSHIANDVKRHGIRVHSDLDEEQTPGAKFYAWELKGVPIRLELGPRDLEKRAVVLTDRLGEKKSVSFEHVVQEIGSHLDAFHDKLFQRARARRDALIMESQRLEQFGPLLLEKNVVIRTGWCRQADCEGLLKQYKASIRCLLETELFSHCFACDRASEADSIIAKSY